MFRRFKHAGIRKTVFWSLAIAITSGMGMCHRLCFCICSGFGDQNMNWPHMICTTFDFTMLLCCPCQAVSQCAKVNFNKPTSRRRPPAAGLGGSHTSISTCVQAHLSWRDISSYGLPRWGSSAASSRSRGDLR